MKLISNPPFISKYVMGPFFFILGMIFSMAALFASHINGLQTTSFAVRLLAIVGGTIGGVLGLISGLSLADEVWDAGDEVIVRKSGYRERIPLANIISLTHHGGRTPYSILTLRVPCRFGRKITFLTILHGQLFRPRHDPAIYDGLTVRINEARRQALRNGSA